ncbi:MAG: 50S ribosomal protein L5 [Euryarchaeota archaeon RBG_19FT_COMBO_56_21]|nr:LSU ribosomal protein L5P [uncultured archaeon]AJS13306.1 LSU ribosomal protein L5P [uncultured archaeon]OGS55740.1 MAG: 50S ribosomal protein L5 [Euryarchaeota archaeon RBG_19FT_COMBO_56_21]
MTDMREIRLHKAVVNIGVGDAGERLLKAEKVLKMVTGKKPVRTKSKTTNRDFGIRQGMQIGCKVTLRGKEAEEFVKKAFWVRENRIATYSFDPEGNFSFGVQDYTDFPGMKYDPEIGIFGLDVCSVIGRPGRRISQRRALRRKVPTIQRVTKKEGMEFVKKKFGVEVVD